MTPAPVEANAKALTPFQVISALERPQTSNTNSRFVVLDIIYLIMSSKFDIIYFFKENQSSYLTLNVFFASKKSHFLDHD